MLIIISLILFSFLESVIPDDINSMGYAADTKMHLSSEKMNNLGWKAEVELKDMYLSLIEFIKNI